jgi:ubiquinone/menaquinone biosynthesis C-methylase UbiE
MDWGIGRYESTAAQLLPAARVVVDHAAPRPGEDVVDIGCGTGNAALLAAERGARVTAVDPTPRLLEVARADAAERGLDATFVAGEAAALPLADASADVVLSVFGVIFAPDAQAALAEMARITAPGGRILISAWIPVGALSELARMGRAAVNAALGAPPGPPPFAWHDRDALSAVLAPHHFSVALQEESIAFTAPSARAYLEEQGREHPLSIAAQAILEPRGEAEALGERMLQLLEDANEDPGAFRVTSRYVVATATR